MNRIVFASVVVCSLASATGSAFAQERVVKSSKVAAAPTSVGDGSTLVAPTKSAVVVSHPGVDLADIRTQNAAAKPSVDERTITVAAVTETKIARALATPRLLRRMGADKMVIKLAESFRACYVADPVQKSTPDAIVRVEIDATGSIDQTSVESASKATPQIRACILTATTSTKFNAPGGIGTAMLVQVRTH
jgi:hypothetical protein